MAHGVARAISRIRGIVLAVVFGLCSVLHLSPLTPKGVQCPTAPVQSVTEVVYVKNCCGKIVPQTIQRKPREGESAFVQCRCAEKKAAETQQKTESNESSRFSFVAILTPNIDFKVPVALVFCNLGIMCPESAILSDQTEPLTPPPRLV